MDVTIGVRNVAREISFETDASADELSKIVVDAAGEDGIARFTDHAGRTILVPARAIGYVEVGSPATRPVGFGS